MEKRQKLVKSIVVDRLISLLKDKSSNNLKNLTELKKERAARSGESTKNVSETF